VHGARGAQAVLKTVTSQAGVMAAVAITETAKFDIVRQQKRHD
jgi:uncharacterized protein with ACT and thioredoxin-like domain